MFQWGGIFVHSLFFYHFCLFPPLFRGKIFLSFFQTLGLQGVCNIAITSYQSNRYSVPLGTYQKDKDVYIEITAENRLVIREQTDGPVIANHIISFERGKLIQDRQHTRDRTKGIAAYISTVSSYFTDEERAIAFLEEIHHRYPRYVRDQLGIVLKMSKDSDQRTRDEALCECIKRGIYSASEYSDVLAFI